MIFGSMNDFEHLEPAINFSESTMSMNPRGILNTLSNERFNFQTIDRKGEYMQVSIIKPPEIVKWLFEDQELESFSTKVIEEVNPIFQKTSSVDAYTIELEKEDIMGEDDLTIYINLTKKVTQNEMMDLWGKISTKSIEIINNITRSHKDAINLRERTTITLRRF